jgi:hypothetical protein
MEAKSQLRQAVLTWLEQARELPSIPQAITDVALSTQPGFEAVINAVVSAAPKSEHRDLSRGQFRRLLHGPRSGSGGLAASHR